MASFNQIRRVRLSIRHFDGCDIIVTVRPPRTQLLMFCTDGSPNRVSRVPDAVSFDQFPRHCRKHVIVFIDALQSLASELALHGGCHKEFLPHEGANRMSASSLHNKATSRALAVAAPILHDRASIPRLSNPTINNNEGGESTRAIRRAPVYRSSVGGYLLVDDLRWFFSLQTVFFLTGLMVDSTSAQSRLAALMLQSPVGHQRQHRHQRPSVSG
jgi:hypothetical protein